MKSLEGRRVLVTGAARGLGLETAIAFAGRGSALLLADIDAAALEEARDAVAVLGVPVEVFRADVTDRAQVVAMRERCGPVDILVNNAGVVHGGAFAEVPFERHAQTIDVNVVGLISMTHAFLQGLVERREAHIVNIASASGFIGLPYGSSYAASKWAVLGFTESIRLELEREGHRHVGVTAICPSYIDTGMFEGVAPPKTTRMLSPERIAQRIVEAVLGGETWVIEPWLARITPPLKGLLPTPLFDAISSALGATDSMLGWKGRASEPPARGGAPADAEPAHEGARAGGDDAGG